VAAIVVLTAGVAYATAVTIKSKKVTLPADSHTHKVSAECPIGTKAAGGGIKLGDNVNDYFQGSHPSSTNRRLWVAEAWRDAAEGSAATFTSYALCVKGQLKIRSKTKTLPNDDTSHSATANCPAGTKATGGGTQLGDNVVDYLTGTYPAGTSGWTAAALRLSSETGSTSFTARVECLPAGKVTVKSKQFSLPDDGGTHFGTVNCGTAGSVTDGGVKLADPNNDVPQGSYPAGKTAWAGGATRGGTGRSSFTVYAVCVK
jgi:hypothetical protein